MPSSDGGDDFVGVGDPLERLRVGVVIFEEAFDGDLKVCDGAEHAALETPLGQYGEETLDGVEPGRGGGCEVKEAALMAREPLENGGMLVSGVVVENGMDGFADGNLALDGVEEAYELLMAVALM